MLRVISSFYTETRALELLANYRRDVFILFRTYAAATSSNQTVLTNEDSDVRRRAAPPPPPPPPPPSPPPPPPPRRAWTVAAAIAFTASIGGVYFYKRLSDDEKKLTQDNKDTVPGVAPPTPYPAEGEAFPRHVTFLVAGAGTAAFSAMRALRAASPDAQVLLVGEEMAVPYMRPPLSKEAWREAALACGGGAGDGDGAGVEARGAEETLTFRQWNGRRRALAYEPRAFYTPVERLGAGAGDGAGDEAGAGDGTRLAAGGAACARGWRVRRLHVERREAELEAAGGRTATVRYHRCLLAVGDPPAEEASGRVHHVHSLAGARRLAAALDEAVGAAGAAGAEGAVVSAGALGSTGAVVSAEAARRPVRVAVLGGGPHACELAAALAQALEPRARCEVMQIHEGETPLAELVPGPLGEELAAALRAAGVTPVRADPGTGIADAADAADIVVDCSGRRGASGGLARLAAASGLEMHPELGGLVVNAELQARDGVYVAGDAACYYDVLEGVRRRVRWHDHAVASGRRAGENMAAGDGARPLRHRPMLWADVPGAALEAVGRADAALPTVSVFSPAGQEGGERRGVVFYLSGGRVVGVLLWNLFNRAQLARQVLEKGEFQDLFEVAKLFSIYDED